MKYSNMLTIFSNDSHVPMFLVTPVLVKPSSLQQLNRNAHRGSKLRVSHCHAVNLCIAQCAMDFKKWTGWSKKKSNSQLSI